MAVKNTVSIRKTSKGKLPRLPFVALKEAVLGKNYELSIAFVTAEESRRLNKIYRGKNKPANILSFPLGRKEGEIIITQSEVRKGARKFGHSFATFLPLIFVHGLFHLKGLRHGSTMERKEKTLLKKFGLSTLIK